MFASYVLLQLLAHGTWHMAHGTELTDAYFPDTVITSSSEKKFMTQSVKDYPFDLLETTEELVTTYQTEILRYQIWFIFHCFISES